MLPCFYKFIVKEDIPLRMVQLAVTVCHEVSRWRLTPEMVACKILKLIWKLEIVLVTNI